MTPDELERLVRIVASNDGRTTGDADVQVWVAAIGDLPYADCAEAVLRHVRDGDGWLRPADVRRAVKAVRTRRLEASFDAPPDADPDDVHGYLAALRAKNRRIADGEVVEPMPEIDTAGRQKVERFVRSAFREIEEAPHA